MLPYSPVLKMSDHENLRLYNEDQTFVPEKSKKSIRKKSHRKRYRNKHGNQVHRNLQKKLNNVSSFL